MICKGESSSGYKKELKRQMKRKRRREEKQLLGNTHKKNEYKGWSI